MFLYLLSLLLLLCCIHVYCKYNNATRAVTKIPTPEGLFIVGNGFGLMKSPEGLFNHGRELAKRFKNIYGWWSVHVAVVNPLNPEDIETVISSTKNIEKGILYKIMKNWLREGLLMSKDKKWAQRRKILTPTFHFNILKRFVVAMEENSQRLLEVLRQSGGKPIDIIPFLSDYTLSTLCETSMGTKLQDETTNEGNIYKQAIHNLGKCLVTRMSRIFYFPDIIFNLSPVGMESNKHLKTATNFTKRIIKERKEYIEKNGIEIFSENIDDDMAMNGKKHKISMLDLLIHAEKGGVIDGPGIQEEVDTFMFEGHDTTAAGLNYCLMLLANHQDIQAKIQEELQEVFGNSDRGASIEDLNSLRYLDCCIKESLRLYPPVPFIGRTLGETVVLSGYTIPAGVQCHIHIYDLHRNPDLYKDPLKFDPDRFLPENSAGRHPYAYIPFSAGPRNCIGQKFALLEMKSCITAILRTFDLKPVTVPEDIIFTAHLVLKNSNPINVRFVERVPK